MPEALLALPYALWGGLWWRVRGGAWETLLRLPPGTAKARVATSAAIALPLLVYLNPWALAVWTALFAGMAVAGWGDAMDIGRVRGTRWLDTAAMSGWGLLAVAPAAAVLAALGLPCWPLAVAGAVFGPAYALAWWLGDLELLPRVPRFAAGATEWAECVVGAAIAAALAVAVLPL